MPFGLVVYAPSSGGRLRNVQAEELDVVKDEFTGVLKVKDEIDLIHPPQV